MDETVPTWSTASCVLYGNCGNVLAQNIVYCPFSSNVDCIEMGPSIFNLINQAHLMDSLEDPQTKFVCMRPARRDNTTNK